MKVAIPIEGNNENSIINCSFGRTKKVLLADTISSEFTLVDNIQNKDAAQGAGIQTAQNIIQAGADILITLNCGPKAFKVLQDSGVKVYQGEKISAIENISEFKLGNLKSLDDSNIEEHWV